MTKILSADAPADTTDETTQCVRVGFFRKFFHRRLNARIGATLMVLFVAAALLGMVWTPYDPLAVDFAQRLLPPSAAHWIGTDQFGRDVLSRLLVGARESLAISSISVLFAAMIGTVVGATAGYFGGAVDRAVTIVMDALMAFPSLMLALGIVAVLGPGRNGVIIALAVSYSPGVARIVRSTALSLRQREFVAAARSLGKSNLRILADHVVPNCVAPLTVLSTSLFATALLSESALAFLGLGVPPPNPTWGGMLAETKQFATSAPWLVLAPGLVISSALLAANLLGDALRDYFDPRMSTE